MRKAKRSATKRRRQPSRALTTTHRLAGRTAREDERFRHINGLIHNLAGIVNRIGPAIKNIDERCSNLSTNLGTLWRTIEQLNVEFAKQADAIKALDEQMKAAEAPPALARRIQQLGDVKRTNAGAHERLELLERGLNELRRVTNDILIEHHEEQTKREVAEIAAGEAP